MRGLLGQQVIRGNQRNPLACNRNIAGTYIGADGLLHLGTPGVLRPNYVQNSSGIWAQDGYLKEGQATNLVQNSAVIPVASGGGSVQNINLADPMGGTLANRIWSQTGTITFSGPTISAGTYCSSMYYRNLGEGITGSVNINIGRTVIGSLTVTVTGASPVGMNFIPASGFSGGIINMGDGSAGSWKRIWSAGPLPAGDASWIQGASGKYHPGIVETFGFQIETGETATSYIPTTGSAVTRTAD